MEETYGFREYFDIVWRQKRIILAAALVALSIGAALIFIVFEPVYEAGTTLMVNRTQSRDEKYLTYKDMMLNQELANTYRRIAKSRAVLEKTMDDLNIVMDVEEFAKSISVTILEDTEIVEIKVRNGNARMSAVIANKLADSFKGEISSIMKMENVDVIDSAEVPQEPIKPRKKLILAAAGFLGLAMGLVMAFINEYFYRKIKTLQDVEKELGIRVIGAIPDYKQSKH